ncbi:MAG: ankyrin repeat domain-containing protein [Candidatus Dependentiae bacterium]|nr:ankyrin repeat domain-containing protein [Candidatus Dependentiae bacterium]
MVKALLAAGAQVNAQDMNGWTALMRAIGQDDLDTTLELLRAKAAVNTKNTDKTTALLIAAHYSQKANSAKIIDALLAAGADVKAQDKNGWTALHWAAKRGHNTVVQTLIKKGASVDAKNNEGQTPLILADQKKRLAVVKTLIAEGADTSLIKTGAQSTLTSAELAELLDKKVFDEDEDAFYDPEEYKNDTPKIPEKKTSESKKQQEESKTSNETLALVKRAKKSITTQLQNIVIKLSRGPSKGKLSDMHDKPYTRKDIQPLFYGTLQEGSLVQQFDDIMSKVSDSSVPFNSVEDLQKLLYTMRDLLNQYLKDQTKKEQETLSEWSNSIKKWIIDTDQKIFKKTNLTTIPLVE